MTHPEHDIQPEEGMGISYQEKSTVVSMMTAIIVFAIYCVIVLQRFQAGDFDTEGVLKFWGVAMLIMVPVQIVAQIITQIVYVIIEAIATREEPSTLSDELDHLIELKSMRITYIAFLLGFFLAMGALAFGAQVEAMFIILFFSFIVSGVIGNLMKLYFYRRGF